MSGSPTIIGVDGGGSKTQIAVADQSGRIVRMARGAGINPMDNRGWRQSLEAQLRPFAGEPGLSGIAAALPAFGEVAAISAEQQQVVAEVFGGLPQRVLNDVDAAHLGAFAGGPGILILSGTGSMAWARDAAGTPFRVGGWGDLIGDEGSSHWIGMRVLGLVSQSLDGRAEPTGLVEAVFDHLGLDRNDPMNALEGWVAHLGHPRAEIASLAPLATRLAEAGDAGAAGIIDSSAAELARHVTAIARLSGLPPDWSFAGGTFASTSLRSAVARLIGRPPRQPLLPPIGGALLGAATLVGWPADDGWTRRVAQSIRDYAAPVPEPAQDRQRLPTN